MYLRTVTYFCVMNKWFILVLLCTPFWGMANTNEKEYSIRIALADVKDSTACSLNVFEQTKTVIQTGMVLQGKAIFKGNIQKPGMHSISFPTLQKEIFVFLNAEEYELSGALDNPIWSKSLTQKIFEEMNGKFSPFFKQIQNLNNYFAQYPSKRDSLVEEFNTINDRIQAGVDQFVDQYKFSPVSALLLVQTQQITKPEVLQQRFEMLDKNATDNLFGQSIKESIDINNFGSVGSNLPVFEEKDINGKMLSIKSFKGKYVLVDFWASWCGPCRRESPYLVSTYEKYKKNGFTILSVSLDDDRGLPQSRGSKAAWLQAIQDDGLSAWTHVSGLDGFENKVAQQFRVSAIPTNYLIDPNGKILAKNLRGEELNVFLNNMFSGKGKPITTSKARSNATTKPKATKK
jgi:thiol-disulfide isomerase/thioredoxin